MRLVESVKDLCEEYGGEYNIAGNAIQCYIDRRTLEVNYNIIESDLRELVGYFTEDWQVDVSKDGDDIEITLQKIIEREPEYATSTEKIWLLSAELVLHDKADGLLIEAVEGKSLELTGKSGYRKGCKLMFTRNSQDSLFALCKETIFTNSDISSVSAYIPLELGKAVEW